MHLRFILELYKLRNASNGVGTGLLFCLKPKYFKFAWVENVSRLKRLGPKLVRLRPLYSESLFAAKRENLFHF